MDHILRQIANTLIINSQKIPSHGLMKGKMGLILYFFEYYRYTGDSYYERFAEHLLDEVLTQADKVSLDIQDGVTGIGWGIEYLLRNNFVEGEADEILSDFDQTIYEKMSATNLFVSKTKDSLFSSGLYYLIRHKGRNKKRDRKQIVTLLNSIEIIFSEEEVRHLSLLNSVFYFLIEISEFDNADYDFENLFGKLAIQIQRSMVYGFYDKNDLDCLGSLLAKKNTLFSDNSELKGIIQANDCAVNEISYFIKGYWQQLLYGTYPVQKSIGMDELNSFFNTVVLNYDPSELVLSKGITGIGLALLKSSSSGM